MGVFKDATADGGEEVRVENFANAMADALVAKNAGEVAQGGVAVAGLAVAEELTDLVEDVVALRLANWHRRGDGCSFMIGPFRFGNDLLVLGLRGGRGPRRLYPKGGGDSGAVSPFLAAESADSSTILISSGVKP